MRIGLLGRLALALVIGACAADAKPAHKPQAKLPVAQTPAAPAPYLYRAYMDKSREVVVDVDAEPVALNIQAALVFFFYAAKTQGVDIIANYFEFDCQKGRARLTKTAKDTRAVEPLVMKPIDTPWYAPPPASVIGQMLPIACTGHGAIPPAWAPLNGSLRDVAKAYFQGVLGQPY